MNRLIVFFLAASILTGCATSGPRRAPTETELKKAADVRVCKKQTLGFVFIPYVGGIMRDVNYRECMEKRGWDMFSAKAREALYGAREATAPSTEGK